uniref:Uncharacterized protein n=1 Tax=Oryza barthii TaxID=65489 RepID=A0A0D3HDF3_9ORYZ
MPPPPPPSVRTRSVTSVALPTHGDGGGCRRVPLSPFDAYWVALPPVRRVFLFPSPPPFGDVVRVLRDSLEAVLPAFYPFAGALESLSIVVEAGGGVAFVEAETDLDLGRLVDEGEEHDEDALRQLVPDIRRDELPAPVMAAQVTEFVGGGGGVAVGVAMHHAAADGRGLWRFLEMWSAAAAAAVATSVREALPPLLHDRTLVRFDGDGELARLFLRQIAADLPKIVHAPLRQCPLSRRTPAARAELASMNHDGEVVLVAGREAGSVQASVAIAADKMPAFREMFVVGCGWREPDSN